MSLNTVLAVNSTKSVVLGGGSDPAQLVAPIRWTLNDQRTWTSAGAGAGVVAVEWPYAATLAAATVDYDLTALPTLLAGGSTITLAKVRVLAIEAAAANAAALSIQPSGAANPWTTPFAGPFTLAPGSKIFSLCPSAAGWAVSGGAKILRVGGTVGDSFKIYLGGE